MREKRSKKHEMILPSLLRHYSSLILQANVDIDYASEGDDCLERKCDSIFYDSGEECNGNGNGDDRKFVDTKVDQKKRAVLDQRKHLEVLLKAFIKTFAVYLQVQV